MRDLFTKTGTANKAIISIGHWPENENKRIVSPPQTIDQWANYCPFDYRFTIAFVLHALQINL